MNSRKERNYSRSKVKKKKKGNIEFKLEFKLTKRTKSRLYIFSNVL